MKPESVGQWRKTERGFENGRFQVILEGPSRWLLMESGREHGRYPTASAAKLEAEHLERQQHKRLQMLRLGIGLTIVVALLIVSGLERVGPSPQLQAAKGVVSRIDEAYRVIADGSANVEDFTGPEVVGERVQIDDEEALDVLVGEADGSCYVLYWSANRERTARVLDVSHGVPCDASVAVGLWNLDWHGASSSWDSVLPSATEERVWFLPAVVLLVGVGLSLLWRLIATASRRS